MLYEKHEAHDPTGKVDVFELSQGHPQTLGFRQMVQTETKNQTKLSKKTKSADAFAPVELVMPVSEIKKDKELMQKIQPPKWESFTYLMDKDSKCQKIHHSSDKERQEFFKQQLSENPHSAKLMLAQGDIQ